MTDREKDFGMAWPCIEFPENEFYREDAPWEMEHFSPGEVQKFQGNAIHLPIYTCWMMHFHMYAIRRSIALEFLPDINTPFQRLANRSDTKSEHGTEAESDTETWR